MPGFTVQNVRSALHQRKVIDLETERRERRRDENAVAAQLYPRLLRDCSAPQPCSADRVVCPVCLGIDDGPEAA